MLFSTVLFDSWAHFHKHTVSLNKMNVITNLKKADKVKQSNNMWQKYIITANLCDMLYFSHRIPLDLSLLPDASYSEEMLKHTLSILYHQKTPSVAVSLMVYRG